MAVSVRCGLFEVLSLSHHKHFSSHLAPTLNYAVDGSETYRRWEKTKDTCTISVFIIPCLILSLFMTTEYTVRAEMASTPRRGVSTPAERLQTISRVVSTLSSFL